MFRERCLSYIPSSLHPTELAAILGIETAWARKPKTGEKPPNQGRVLVHFTSYIYLRPFMFDYIP
jgi:hypothetical protein